MGSPLAPVQYQTDMEIVAPRCRGCLEASPIQKQFRLFQKDLQMLALCATARIGVHGDERNRDQDCTHADNHKRLIGQTRRNKKNQ
jgi:hypothetical protein